MRACQKQLACMTIAEKTVEKLHVESWKWKCGIVDNDNGNLLVVSKFRALAEVAKQRLSFRSNASCPKNYKVIQFILILL